MADFEIADVQSVDAGPIADAGPAIEQPVKRPRGRPRGSGKNGSGPGKIDPAQFAASRSDASRQKAWRDRKRAAADAAEKEFVQVAQEGVAANIAAAPIDQNSAKQISEMLFMMHNMAASALSMPEFALQPSESEMLGQATASVARHYKWGGMAEKTKDWLMLVGALSIVYPPRFRAIKERRRGGAAKPVVPAREAAE